MAKMSPKWDRTVIMMRRLSLDEGLYSGLPVIHRDSPIDGGVYLGKGQREAIVVDSQKYPRLLKKLYEIAKKRAMKNETLKKDKILNAVYETVSEALPIQDDNAVRNLIKDYGFQNDIKVSLDLFLNSGIGVCRHSALACGALLELFKKDGIIRGEVSIDRNSTFLGGHAWCRYTSFNRRIFILDVTLQYLGALNDASEKSIWGYKRLEDI